MTAGERLRQLAGQAGAAGALLLLIGTGATAGAALVDYSGLPTGTAAEHLLADRVAITPYQGGGGPDEEDWERAVLEHRKRLYAPVFQEDAEREVARVEAQEEPATVLPVEIVQPVPPDDGLLDSLDVALTDAARIHHAVHQAARVIKSAKEAEEEARRRAADEIERANQEAALLLAFMEFFED